MIKINNKTMSQIEIKRLKNATLIRADGKIEYTPPAGKKYTLKELQKAVQGLIEILPTPRGQAMIVNENGQLDRKEINIIASEMMEMLIVGDVIYIDPVFLKI